MSPDGTKCVNSDANGSQKGSPRMGNEPHDHTSRHSLTPSPPSSKDVEFPGSDLPKKLSLTNAGVAFGSDAPLDHSAAKLFPVPPDGGYGWVIIVACFLCNAIVEGTVGSFGVFMPHLMGYFGGSQGKMAVAGSVLIGGFLVSGPIVSALVNCFGCRVVTMSGAVIACVGFVLSTLAPSVNVFILLYGALGGLGVGMLYLPAMLMVGFYFERRRSLATGIAYSGAGMGMLVMAPTCATLLSVLDWKNSLILLSGFVLQGLVLGALMRPLQPQNDERDVTGLETTPSTEDNKDLVSEQSFRSSRDAADDCRVAVDIPQGTFGESRCSSYSSAVRAVVVTDVITRPAVKTQSLNVLSVKANSAFPRLIETEPPGNTSVQATPLLTESCLELPSDPSSRNQRLHAHKNIRNHLDSGARQYGDVRFVSYSELARVCEDTFSQIDLEKLKTEMWKPLARRDIFYSGSVSRLPEFQAQPDMASYIASVTMIPVEDLSKSVSSRCPCLSRSTLATLYEMIDVAILANPYFLIICLASIFIQVAYFVPIVFVPVFAASLEIDPEKASMLISVIGVANTVGRAGAGCLANIPRVHDLHLNNISLIVSGISTIAVVFICNSFTALVVYAAIFGMFIAAFVPLTTIFLVRFLGLHRLNNAMGLLSMVRGLASMAGPPIAGVLLDKYSSYTIVFSFAGTMFVMAGLTFYLLPIYHKWNIARGQSAVLKDPAW